MKSIYLLFLLGFVWCVESCERHGAKCPEYTVLQVKQDYEERRYEPMVWVSATSQGKSKLDVSRKLIKLIYAYLGGENDQGKKIEMMVPVRTKKLAENGVNTYTMAVIVSSEQGESIPLPVNQSVHLNEEPATTYLVRSFDGYARQDSVWDDQAESLRASVASDSAVDTSYYYMSVYDSPWRESDRLNEVWMKKTED